MQVEQPAGSAATPAPAEPTVPRDGPAMAASAEPPMEHRVDGCDHDEADNEAIDVKAYCGAEIRRFALPPAATFDELLAKIMSVFSLTEQPELSWDDDDEDRVALLGQEDWAYCVENRDDTIHLRVAKAKAPASSAAAATPAAAEGPAASSSSSTGTTDDGAAAAGAAAARCCDGCGRALGGCCSRYKCPCCPFDLCEACFGASRGGPRHPHHLLKVLPAVLPCAIGAAFGLARAALPFAAATAAAALDVGAAFMGLQGGFPQRDCCGGRGGFGFGRGFAGRGGFGRGGCCCRGGRGGMMARGPGCCRGGMFDRRPPMMGPSGFACPPQPPMMGFGGPACPPPPPFFAPWMGMGFGRDMRRCMRDMRHEMRHAMRQGFRGCCPPGCCPPVPGCCPAGCCPPAPTGFCFPPPPPTPGCCPPGCCPPVPGCCPQGCCPPTPGGCPPAPACCPPGCCPPGFPPTPAGCPPPPFMSLLGGLLGPLMGRGAW